MWTKGVRFERYVHLVVETESGVDGVEGSGGKSEGIGTSEGIFQMVMFESKSYANQR